MEKGKKVPEFKLSSDDEKVISLKDFKGKKIILYFYPKDNTSGCTEEACNFRDKYDEIEKLNAVVIGVSKDSISSHKKFKSKYNLPFILLSDENNEILEKFGVWKEKSMYGKKYMGIERTTFIIDENGKLIEKFEKVKVKGHIDEVLKSLGD